MSADLHTRRDERPEIGPTLKRSRSADEFPWVVFVELPPPPRKRSVASIVAKGAIALAIAVSLLAVARMALPLIVAGAR